MKLLRLKWLSAVTRLTAYCIISFTDLAAAAADEDAPKKSASESLHSVRKSKSLSAITSAKDGELEYYFSISVCNIPLCIANSVNIGLVLLMVL